jgi:hypothetical protein
MNARYFAKDSARIEQGNAEATKPPRIGLVISEGRTLLLRLRFFPVGDKVLKAVESAARARRTA